MQLNISRLAATWVKFVDKKSSQSTWEALYFCLLFSRLMYNVSALMGTAIGYDTMPSHAVLYDEAIFIIDNKN